MGNTSSIDDLFSKRSNVEVNIFGRKKELPIYGEYYISTDLMGLIRDKMKYGQNPLVMEDKVFVYENGILYRWTSSHLEIVVPK